ncbi:hypothetical protein Hanom_Chr14g01269281 [Helianthus anomalus]
MRPSQETYNKHVVDKYGKDTSLHPEIDMELLSQSVGGKKKGKTYGIGTIADSRVVMMGAQERSDNDEVCGTVEEKKITELEQDKIEKHAMMEKIEEGVMLYAEMNEKIQMLSENPSQSPPPT